LVADCWLLIVCCPLLVGRFPAIENPKKTGLQAAFNQQPATSNRL
jgi:hypothetical protein